MRFGAGEVQTLFRETGVDVVQGNNSTRGLLDETSPNLLGFTALGTPASGTSRTLLIQRGTIPDPDLDPGKLLEVDGKSYVIEDSGPIDDGEFILLKLTRAANP